MTKYEIVQQMEKLNIQLKALEAAYELSVKSGGSLSKREALEDRIDKLNDKFCELMLKTENL